MPKWIESIARSIYSWVFAIITAVIGALIYDKRDEVGADLQHTSFATWLLVLYVPLLISVIAAFILMIRTFQELRERVEKQKGDLEQFRDQSALDAQLIELDDTLLRLLPSMVNASDIEQAVTNIIRVLLKEITELLPEKVFRGYVLHLSPDASSIVPWIGYQMSEETMKRTSFHIDGGDNPYMGDAGYAFLHRQVVVVHKDAQEKMDSIRYIDFEKERKVKPYKSFVCVPLIDINNDCVGVLCLDSITDGTVFDAKGIKELLLALAARLATVITIYQLLQNRQRS